MLETIRAGNEIGVVRDGLELEQLAGGHELEALRLRVLALYPAARAMTEAHADNRAGSVPQIHPRRQLRAEVRCSK